MSIGRQHMGRRAMVGLTATLLALLLLMLAGCAGRSTRPEPAPLSAVPDLAHASRVWSAKLPSTVDFPLQVHVSGNQIVLASSDGSVLTLDAATGRQIARAKVDAGLSGGVGSNGRTLAVITRADQVVALTGGQTLWQKNLHTASYTAPLVAGGRVFVLGADRSLMAFDGRSGTQLWRVQRESDPLVLRQAGLLLPFDDTLVAGWSGRMVGINPDTGDTLWQAPLAMPHGINEVERLIDLVGGVYRQGRTICARAFQAAVGCVDATSGTVLWTHTAQGNTGVDGDAQHVYGTEADGRVLAWRTDTGARAWATDLLQWRVLTAPAVVGNIVAVGDAGGLIHLLSRADGSPVGRLSTDGSGVAATPVAVGNMLVVVTHDGNVFGFSIG